jgi:hypothetical protein
MSQFQSSVPERYLITGHFGSGKSECAARWAKRYRDEGIPGTFYWINTDIYGTVQRVNERWSDWQDNIVWTDVKDWLSLGDASTEYQERATSDDVIVLDSAEKAWTWVRDYWDYLKAVKAGVLPRRDDPFGFVPQNEDKGKWDPINAAYQRWFVPLLDDQNPGHLIVTSPSQPLKYETERNGKITPGDDKRVIAEFGRFGIRPAGQKFLGFNLHSVFLAAHAKDGYTLTTMKDRGGRPYLQDAPVDDLMDFTRVVLEDTAGWKV